MKQQNKKLIVLLTTAGMLTTYPAFAASVDSGSILQGAQPPARQQPIKDVPSINVKQEEPQANVSEEQKIQVNGFRISGESPVPEAKLLAMLTDHNGHEMTLGELNKLIDKLTQYLRQQGYLVAFAYIPAQEVKEGIVEIVVVPGKYGQIKINGNSHISSDRIKAMLFNMKPSTVITREPLERAILLINDLNGVSVKSNLNPGETAGTADLVLELTAKKKIDGTFYMDNWGNPNSGQTRTGIQITVNNVSGMGDGVNLGGLLTDSSWMNVYNVGYSMPLGYEGARFNVSHSRVHYVLGEGFASLGVGGKVVTDEVNLNYPIIRSREFNLTGTAGYSHKCLQDDITANSSYSHRRSNLWNTGLSGDFTDNWLGGGSNTFSLVRYQGSITIEDAATAAMDAATRNTAGDFSKMILSFQRQQKVVNHLNFLLLFNGQLSSKNLDSSEKFYLGGADGVRAYSQGEAGGDEGYRVTGEFRWQMPGASVGPNNLYLTSFYDYGSVKINQTSYSGAGINRRSLMGAGVGLLWTRDNDFAIKMDYAWKIGRDSANNELKNGRLWLQGMKYF